MKPTFTDREIAAAIGAESHRQLITWRQRGHLPNRRKDLSYALHAYCVRVLADYGLHLDFATTAAKTLTPLMRRALKDGKGPHLVAVSPVGTVTPLPAQLERIPFGGTIGIIFDFEHAARFVRERLAELSWSAE
jgi:hypothetical protein